MKKLLPCLLILLVQNLRSQTVTVYGTIENANGNKTFIRYIKDYLTYDQVVMDSSNTDKKGNFSMTFPWKKTWPVFFESGNESTEMLLTPGDSIRLTVDQANFDNSLQYSGQGGIVNNYLAKKVLRNSNSQRLKIKASKAMDEKRFSTYIDSVYNDNMQFFNSYFNEKNNSGKAVSAYINSESKDLLYIWANDRFRYPGYHSYFNDLKVPLEVSPQYYDFLRKINFNDPASLSSHLYIESIDLYINYSMKQLLGKDSSLKDKGKYAKAEEEFIERNFSGDVKNKVIAAKAYNLVVQQNDLAQGKKMIDKFVAANGDKEVLTILENAYAVASSLAPGNPAPGFSYSDLGGKKVSLSDFKGQIVYLDIWASWCGPCLKEIPAAKKLEEEMKGKGVVFLCVSVDDDEKSWRSTVKAKEISGIQLLCQGEFSSEIAKLYNVKSIPRYVLIDKEGKLVNSNAGRPSGTGKEEIEKLLPR
jgi:thiol-disulfide isomerase/thioredoxin